MVVNGSHSAARCRSVFMVTVIFFLFYFFLAVLFLDGFCIVYEPYLKHEEGSSDLSV